MHDGFLIQTVVEYMEYQTHVNPRYRFLLCFFQNMSVEVEFEVSDCSDYYSIDSLGIPHRSGRGIIIGSLEPDSCPIPAQQRSAADPGDFFYDSSF